MACQCCAAVLSRCCMGRMRRRTALLMATVLQYSRLLLRYLDTCRHMKSCKYVHYEIDPADRHKLTELNKVLWHHVSALYSRCPRGLQCSQCSATVYIRWQADAAPDGPALISDVYAILRRSRCRIPAGACSLRAAAAQRWCRTNGYTVARGGAQQTRDSGLSVALCETLITSSFPYYDH